MRTKFLTGIIAAGVAVAVASGCASSTTPAASGESSAPVTAPKVGLLLPEQLTVRWDSLDKPAFEKALQETCPTCEFLYGNAAGDQTKQQSQADSMIAQGVNILVITPVDVAAAQTIVENAQAQGIKVIGYMRVPNGKPDGTVGDDDATIGKANGTALVEALKARNISPSDGKLVWQNGDKASGPSTMILRDNAMDVVTAAGYEVGREFHTKNWDPATAQRQMDQAITALGADQIIGVYSMNDGMAGGSVAAMKSAGIDPLPPVTGMDAEVAAVQRLIVGEQTVSIFPNPNNGGRAAGEVAGKLALGQEVTPAGTLTNSSGNEIPFYSAPQPEVITADNAQELLVDTGIRSATDICTEPFKAACEKYGIR